MHVDWRWIKQRPHFIAENLAAEHDIRVLHRLGVGSQLKADNAVLSPSPLLPIPWSWKLLRGVTKAIQRRWVGILGQPFKPDTIWLTHPFLIETIPSSLAKLPIVYDCMDDVLEFTASANRRVLVRQLERRLIERASLVLCSSVRLREVLISRYGERVGTKIELVRNGVSLTLLNTQGTVSNVVGHPISGRYKIGYFGTISEWFDFDLLMGALDANAQIEFHLVGPVTFSRWPKHERLEVHKPVRHEELVSLAAGFDACMMPFRMSPLVSAVDPIKLYEYLAFGKEIVTVYYKEVERFADFVHFYDDLSSFNQVIGRLVSGTAVLKNVRGKRDAFLAENTWSARYAQIAPLLQCLKPTAN